MTDRLAERGRECNGSLNTPVSDARTCAAAHRLHKTHYAWARSLETSDPTECYQCHVFARIVLEAAAEFDAPVGGQEPPDPAPIDLPDFHERNGL